MSRSRGLCFRCFYSPDGIRALYPVGSGNPATAKYTRFCDRDPSVTPDFMGQAALPDVPTTAAPGTEAKMRVMKRRVKARRAVHHPADARYAGDRRPLEWMQKRQGREIA